MACEEKTVWATTCHVRTESVGVESATYGEHLCSPNPYLPWPQRLRESTAPETHSTRLSKALLSSLGSLWLVSGSWNPGTSATSAILAVNATTAVSASTLLPVRARP